MSDADKINFKTQLSKWITKNKRQPLGAVPFEKCILTRSVANRYFQLYATEVHTTLVRKHNELLSLSVTANKEFSRGQRPPFRCILPSSFT